VHITEADVLTTSFYQGLLELQLAQAYSMIDAYAYWSQLSPIKIPFDAAMAKQFVLLAMSNNPMQQFSPQIWGNFCQGLIRA
jgi:hypothetical protein